MKLVPARPNTTRRAAALLGATVLAAGALTGCADGDDTAATAQISVADGYVKSASMTTSEEPMTGSMSSPDASMDMEMEPMSAAFMTISNDTGAAVTLTGGSTPAATTVEIHEVVDGVMRPVEGGLAIADGGSEQLQPGGNHVMLIGLTRDLKTGDEVPLALSFSNGETLELTLPVKEIAGADEPYASASPSS